MNEISKEQISRIMDLVRHLNRMDGYLYGLAIDINDSSRGKAQILNDFREEMASLSEDMDNLCTELKEQVID